MSSTAQFDILNAREQLGILTERSPFKHWEMMLCGVAARASVLAHLTPAAKVTTGIRFGDLNGVQLYFEIDPKNPLAKPNIQIITVTGKEIPATLPREAIWEPEQMTRPAGLIPATQAASSPLDPENIFNGIKRLEFKQPHNRGHWSEYLGALALRMVPTQEQDDLAASLETAMARFFNGHSQGLARRVRASFNKLNRHIVQARDIRDIPPSLATE